MGCRCNERRSAIVSGIRSIVKGDKAAAAAQAKFVAKSSIEDAKAAYQSRISSARSKLARR